MSVTFSCFFLSTSLLIVEQLKIITLGFIIHLFALISRSDRKSKNCAIFYFKHLDTDSEADCGQLVQEPSNAAMDDSSEEEWTYTSAPRKTDSSTVSERQKTNIVVRLDFDESPRVDPSENTRSAREGDVGHAREMTARHAHEDGEARQKDSDDERRSDKSSIQRLIKEVENLIGEERHPIASRAFPAPLVLEEKDITNNHRAKYARVKEWLKLNVTQVIFHWNISKRNLQILLLSCDIFLNSILTCRYYIQIACNRVELHCNGLPLHYIIVTFLFLRNVHVYYTLGNDR